MGRPNARDAPLSRPRVPAALRRALSDGARLVTAACYCSPYGHCRAAGSEADESRAVDACRADPAAEFEG